MTKVSTTEAAPTDAPAPSRQPRSTPTILLAVTLGLVLAGICLLAFVPLEREVTGVVVILLVIALLLVGVHIAFAMTLAGVIGLWKLGGMRAIEVTLEQNIFSATASWQLSVIPLFILMGMVMWRTGLAAGAYEAARQWLGKLPGGLAIGTNYAGAGLAAASGSTVGISYALGRMAIPEMLRANYSPRLATSVVAMAGTLGQLIPPSIMLVIYAGIAQTPVGPQLLAAVVPGILLAVAYAVMILVRATVNPKLAPRADLSDVNWRTRARATIGMAPIALIIVVVLGGLFSGIFTSTEAGAFGALAAIVLGSLLTLRKTQSLRAVADTLRHSVIDTALVTSAIFLLLIGVEVLTRVMTLSRVASALAEFVVTMDLGRVQFLLVLIVVYLILGMFLDPMAMMLLTLPVLTPPLLAVGVDMLWYGVFVVMLAEIAIVTPPIGMLSFIVHRMAQDPNVNLGKKISLVDVFAGVLWFVAVGVGMLVILVLFPEIASWLPGQSSAK